MRREGGYAVKQGHLRKLAKFSVSCEAEGPTLLALAAYTFRGWHPVVLATIPKLGRQLARKVGRAVVEAQRPA